MANPAPEQYYILYKKFLMRQPLAGTQHGMQEWEEERLETDGRRMMSGKSQEKSREKKVNGTFRILSAIGILLVVAGFSYI